MNVDAAANLPQTYTAYKAANDNTEEANRNAYYEYLMAMGRGEQTGAWEVGGFPGSGATYEPISHLIVMSKKGTISTDASPLPPPARRP